MSLETKSVANEFIRDITALSSTPFAILITLILLTAGKFQETIQLIVGIIALYAVAVIARQFYFKPRPTPRPYSNWIEKIDAGSFPSIHTARAWMYLIIFGDMFNNIFATIILTITALLISYSRIHLKKHYMVDVVGGTFLGIVVGLLVVLI